MKDTILQSVEKTHLKERPAFGIGDKVSVSVRLKEGDKTRVQVFKGVVICKAPKSGKGPGATFTVRKVSSGVGVERVFAVNSPAIEDIKVESSSVVRQSRLFYLRDLKGKKARLKERMSFDELIVPDAEPYNADAEESTTETTSSDKGEASQSEETK